eukprot:TRINITY_DN9246_c0_g1_i3.p1 TRINITY_DN9246_c0_g1~~TRINITY_DN9246_c0_g1_i3.p1  ORF type:complete len:1062 (+),score=123.06 TRINITY_DN9246_c0_g1_i3:128-3313(+)
MRIGSAGVAAAFCLCLVWLSGQPLLEGGRDARRLRQGSRVADLRADDQKEESAKKLSQTAFTSAPALPNLVKLVTQLCFESVQPPPLLPKLDDLTQQELVQRRDYFLTAGFLIVSAFMVFGMGVTVVGRSCKQSSPGYLRVEPSAPTPADGELGLGQKGLLRVVVWSHFLTNCGMLSVCLKRGAFSSDYGSAWEFWLAWFVGCLVQGLVELVAVLRRGEGRTISITSYPKHMIVSHVPFLSEKADTVKDIMFCALAWHAGDVCLAVFSLAMLALCHELFLESREVEGDLYDAYLPVLAAPPPDSATTKLSAHESVEEQVTEQLSNQTLSCCEWVKEQVTKQLIKAPDWVQEQVFVQLIKQTSTGRLRVALMEDLPQTMLAILFVIRNGDCKYVSGSFTLSMLRIVPSLPCVARGVTSAVSKKMHSELVKSARVGNAAKLHAQLTRLLKKQVSSPLGERSGSVLVWFWRCMACTLLGCFICTTVWASMRNRTEITVTVSFVIVVVLSALVQVYCEYCCCCATFLLWVGSVALSLSLHTWLPIKGLAVFGVVAALLQEVIVLNTQETSADENASGTQFDREQLSLNDRVLMVQVLKTLESKPAELRELGFGVDELAQEYSVVELLGIGFQPGLVLAKTGSTVKKLVEAGITIEELYKMGIPEGLMAEAGYNLEQLDAADYGSRLSLLKEQKSHGCTAKEFKETGYTAKEIHKADLGFSARELLEAGYTVKEMYQAGFSDSQLKASDCTIKLLWEAGYPSNIQSLTKLKEAGFTARDFKDGGYTAKGLQDLQLGFDAKDYMMAGYTAKEMYESGIHLDFIKEAGFNAKHFRNDGYTMKNLSEMQLGLEPKDFRQAGYTAKEMYESGSSETFMKEAGCTLTELKAAGYPSTNQSLIKLREAGFTAGDFRADGYTAGDLYKMRLGFEAIQFKEAGYTSAEIEMYEAGASEYFVKEAGYDLGLLKQAGYGGNIQSLRRLRGAGFTATEFRRAGFSSAQIISAGFGICARNEEAAQGACCSAFACVCCIPGLVVGTGAVIVLGATAMVGMCASAMVGMCRCRRVPDRD